MLIMLLISFSSLKIMTGGNWSDLFVAGHCRLKCLDAWYPLQASHNTVICPCSRVNFYRSLPLYFTNPLCQNRISHMGIRCRPPPTNVEMCVCAGSPIKMLKKLIHRYVCMNIFMYTHWHIYIISYYLMK